MTWRDPRATFRRLPTLVIWEVRRDPKDPGVYTNGTESNMRKAREAAAHILRIMDRTTGDVTVTSPVSPANREVRTMKCDHCKQPVHADRNGWLVGADATSDCPASPKGHQVNGSARA